MPQTGEGRGQGRPHRETGGTGRPASLTSVLPPKASPGPAPHLLYPPPRPSLPGAVWCSRLHGPCPLHFLPAGALVRGGRDKEEPLWGFFCLFCLFFAFYIFFPLKYAPDSGPQPGGGCAASSTPGEAANSPQGCPGCSRGGRTKGSGGMLRWVIRRRLCCPPIPRPFVHFNFPGMLLEFQTLHFSSLPTLGGLLPRERRTSHAMTRVNTATGTCLVLSSIEQVTHTCTHAQRL